ncbi:MarR family winged helix-turn-helix transcriptional regulator [Thermodesulforhabdus norvegica]|uniref:DNA-binding transcriptional regulator, MarR family n=1 Tax=Thermodesulforhabdus norvegica TaxID=39841 RepID=A0A1I4VST2_9BACT|nr:MarR family winged helix-turn-helix transcriptional regulator [Thermodesulforhabdus norvegica]SFN04334.1 DNA-binding transcriptional regulator, MarR family [Thermodesulforhabdus norvegica]
MTKEKEEKQSLLPQIEEIGKRCVCYNVKKVARHITRYYDEALRPSGLRATQYAILMATKAREPISLSELSRITMTDRTTLTRNLSVLQRKGFVVVRHGADDRRQRFVEITEKGREVLLKAIPLWEAAQSRIEKQLGEGRIKRLLDELSEVSKIIRKR